MFEPLERLLDAPAARSTTMSLSDCSAGRWKPSRALAKARPETSRVSDGVPHREAKKASTVACWDRLRIDSKAPISVGSGSLRLRVNALGESG